jgi:hypothetical protein
MMLRVDDHSRSHRLPNLACHESFRKQECIRRPQSGGAAHVLFLRSSLLAQFSFGSIACLAASERESFTVALRKLTSDTDDFRHARLVVVADELGEAARESAEAPPLHQLRAKPPKVNAPTLSSLCSPFRLQRGSPHRVPFRSHWGEIPRSRWL